MNFNMYAVKLEEIELKDKNKLPYQEELILMSVFNQI